MGCSAPSHHVFLMWLSVLKSLFLYLRYTQGHTKHRFFTKGHTKNLTNPNNCKKIDALCGGMTIPIFMGNFSAELEGANYSGLIHLE